MRKNNPHKVVLNRRGKATPAKKGERASATGVKQLPAAYVMGLLRALRLRGVLHDGSCYHSAARVNEATRLVYGNSHQGGAQIAVTYDISAATVAAAYSGYYRVDGEMIFLHSDGSICRIPQGDEGVKCACGAIHG